MDESIFSQEELRLGKYTRWAMRWGVTPETLRTLAWMIGEFNVSAGLLLGELWNHRQEWRGAERGYLALEALCNMARGERFEVDEWSRRLLRGRMSLEVSDLPEGARQALESVSARAAWELVMKVNEGFEAIGKGPAGEYVFVYLTAQGKVIEVDSTRRRRNTMPSAVPATLGPILAGDRPTRWAADRGFSREQLRCLVWVAGEAGGRIQPLLDVLARYPEKVAGHRPALVALQILADMVTFDAWMSVDELRRRIERGRPKLEWQDIPQPLRDALESAAPGVDWTYRAMIPDGYTVAGKAADGKSVAAEISNSGSVSLL